MKKSLFSLALLASFGAQAQTTVAPNFQTTGGKVFINGTNGNINTQGNVNVGAGGKTILSSDGNIFSQGTTLSNNFQTNGGKVIINGANGNVITQGKILAGTATIDAANGNISTLGTTTTNKLNVNSGAQIGGGLDVTNAKITRVFDGTDAMDAVNVRQLDVQSQRITTLNGRVTNEVTRLDGRIDATNTSVTNLTNTVNTNATTAANATAQVQTNLEGERDRAKAAEQSLDNRKADKTALQAEEQARIDGDKRAEQASNTYTDARITQQSGADRAYTDKAVGAERERAMAAEAAISKEVKQVGAMAMAAAGVAGATPVGDKKTAATVALGSYSGQTAIAVGISTLIKENTRMFGAISKVTGGKTGVTVGASFSF